MHTLKLTLAYDGTAYAGWQVQPGQTTVQGTLEAALQKITGRPVRVLASGRTDAGVHALGQVVGLQTDSHLSADVLRRALNAELPGDIAVIDVVEAPHDFHAIRDAVRKRYCYVIHDGPVRDVFQRRYCWHVSTPLDVEAMHRAAQSLLGKHDFSSFETAGAKRESSVRTVFDISVAREKGVRTIYSENRSDPFSSPIYSENRSDPFSSRIVVEVEANGFLYNMVRAIVGTLVEVGRGAQPESWITEVLQATNRSAAGPTAPPQGLFLVKVDYNP